MFRHGVRRQVARDLKRIRGRTDERSAEERLKLLAHCARSGYGLHVWQWLPGHVGTHAPTSLHAQEFSDGVGKAFDAYLPTDSAGLTGMFRFGRFIVRHAPEVSEGIHKYGLSIKNGQQVPSSFWGAVWDEHRNHVHVGCTGR